MSTANGKAMPRVSEVLRILDDSYAGIPARVLEAAAERGEALHRLCLSYLASVGGLCAAPIPTPPYVQPYESFVQWVKDFTVVPVAVEQTSSNDRHGYQGTPDALVTYAGTQNETLIDLKFTAAILRINRVQIQAYWRLDLYKTAQRTVLVHINPVTGDLRQHTIKKNPHDWAAFLNALSIWRWRQE